MEALWNGQRCLVLSSMFIVTVNKRPIPNILVEALHGDKDEDWTDLIFS